MHCGRVYISHHFVVSCFDLEWILSFLFCMLICSFLSLAKLCFCVLLFFILCLPNTWEDAGWNEFSVHPCSHHCCCPEGHVQAVCWAEKTVEHLHHWFCEYTLRRPLCEQPLPSKHAGSDLDAFWLCPVMASGSKRCARIIGPGSGRMQPACYRFPTFRLSYIFPKTTWVIMCKTNLYLIQFWWLCQVWAKRIWSWSEQMWKNHKTCFWPMLPGQSSSDANCIWLVYWVSTVEALQKDHHLKRAGLY